MDKNLILNNLKTEQMLSEIYQLKSIIRYNNKPKLTQETVAEHSFYVALIGLMICDELQCGEKCKTEVMTKALLHDMPEIEINDITHDVKTRLNLSEFLAKYENEYYHIHFPQYEMLMSRHDQLADVIVDLADALSVKQFVSAEISLGNHSAIMQEVSNEITHRIINIKHDLLKMLKGEQ